MSEPALDALPGFRRRIIVVPEPGRVRSDLEDDYHCMSVTIEHADGIATRVAGDMTRVPWTTCPGAEAVIARTFTGVPLHDFLAQPGRTANCTHLHDLALLAAAYADATAPVVFEILVSDPVDEVLRAELRRDGSPVLDWTMKGAHFTEPAAIAGLRLDQLRDWIASLDTREQEHARLLRWGVMLSHGRQRSGRTEFDMAKLPLGQCHTFQPENAAVTKYRPETVREFSGSRKGPLASVLNRIEHGRFASDA